MKISKGYSFDDVLLVPSYSSLGSRNEVSLKTKIGRIGLEVPILSAPMDTVTEENMAMFMWENGGLGVVHRYNTINKQYVMVRWLKEYGIRVAAAIGINGDSKERAEALAEAGVDMFVVDIAHGHCEKALDIVKHLRENYSVHIMSPNIVTPQAARDFVNFGVDVLRVGVGPGSACTTRQVAGVGYPQLTAIENIYNTINANVDSPVKIVADGGIRNSGDVVKALAAGADAVMIGGILAPFVVAAGPTVSVAADEASPVLGVPRYKTMKPFRGMASSDALKNRKDKFVAEGESFLVEVRYDHKEFFNQFVEGIRQGFAYLGAKDIVQLRGKATFVEVTQHGYLEGTPHFKGVKQ